MCYNITLTKAARTGQQEDEKAWQMARRGKAGHEVSNITQSRGLGWTWAWAMSHTYHGGFSHNSGPAGQV